MDPTTPLKLVSWPLLKIRIESDPNAEDLSKTHKLLLKNSMPAYVLEPSCIGIRLSVLHCDGSGSAGFSMYPCTKRVGVSP